MISRVSLLSRPLPSGTWQDFPYMLESGTAARGVAQSLTGREMVLIQLAVTAFSFTTTLSRTLDNTLHRQKQRQLAPSQPVLVQELNNEHLYKCATKNHKEPYQP